MSDQAVQEAVDRVLSRLMETFKNKPSFLAAHFSCGAPGMPGYIIKSAVKARNCRFEDWAKNDKGETDESLHGKVIIRHARQFQRSVTVPALLAKLSFKSQKPILVELAVSANEIPLVVNQGPRSDDCSRFELKLGQKFAEALCPEALLDKYLGGLYRDEMRRGRRSETLVDDLRPFDLPRYEAFGLLVTLSSNLKTCIDALIPPESSLPADEKLQAWMLLGFLQSALIYFSGGQAHGTSIKEVTGFACAFPLEPHRWKPLEKTPFGFALGAPQQAFDCSAVCECFGDVLWTTEVRKHIDGDNSKKRKSEIKALINAMVTVTGMTPGEARKVSNSLKAEAKAIVSFTGPQERLHLLGLWMIYLISKLKGAKHEGKAVDFWFVAGERTEFADEVNVRIDKHPLQIKKDGASTHDKEFDGDKFLKAGDGKLDEASCNLITRRLEKEHYPWFSQGRYSLFFDISTEGLKPCGLAELRSGSWNRLVAESLKSPVEQELRIPGCLVAFVDGASGEAGLLVCQPEKPGKKVVPRVKRALRLRGGRWQLSSEERQRKLAEHLKKNVNWLDNDTANVELLSQMTAMIADDPHAGGMLVFIERKPMKSASLRLGAPWEWENDLFHQDRIPLISHDGATLVWKEEDGIKMAYRHFLAIGNIQALTPEDRAEIEESGEKSSKNSGKLEEILKELQRCSLGGDADFPLLGVGTRRWSAALTALQSSVKMVVVISTDGEITCWWGNAERQELWYHSLPVDFDPTKSKGERNALCGLKSKTAAA